MRYLKPLYRRCIATLKQFIFTPMSIRFTAVFIYLNHICRRGTPMSDAAPLTRGHIYLKIAVSIVFTFKKLLTR
jgi:hypothetical protein